METEATDAREASRRALYDRLENLQKEPFRAEIRRVKDHHLLGDLRYDFNWDPDPRKSTWQAIEINRWLTEIKARREALPQWVAIVVGNLIALAALIISILAYLYKE